MPGRPATWPRRASGRCGTRSSSGSGCSTTVVQQAMALATVAKIVVAVGGALGVFRLARSYGAASPASYAAAVAAPMGGMTQYLDLPSWWAGQLIWALAPWVWWAVRRTTVRGANPVTALVLGYLLVTVGYVYGTIMLIVVLLACLVDAWAGARPPRGAQGARDRSPARSGRGDRLPPGRAHVLGDRALGGVPLRRQVHRRARWRSSPACCRPRRCRTPPTISRPTPTGVVPPGRSPGSAGAGSRRAGARSPDCSSSSSSPWSSSTGWASSGRCAGRSGSSRSWSRPWS